MAELGNDARQAFAREHPAAASTVLGTTQTTTPDVAAFVNGTMVRYYDFNDAYIGLEGGHPSDNIPACLAVGESEGATGEDLVVAIVLAYEIQCRFQDAANLHLRGWDHVNYVLLSSVIAAASLARHGFTGPSPIFEGEAGFMNQITGAFSVDTSVFGNRANRSYAISRTLTKLYPASGQQQTAIWAALAVRGRIPDLGTIDAVQIETTRVGYERAGQDPQKWRPTTRETADHSLPYTVARALRDGEITTATYNEDAISNAQVRTFMQRISVQEDPALTAMFPQYIPNRVTVRLTTGQVLTEEVLDAPGGARVPVTDTQLEDKFHALLRPFASDAQRASILSHAWGIDKSPNLAPLFASMTLDAGTA